MIPGTMTPRERVLAALRHQEPDRVPIDLDGTRASGISAIAYNRLRRHMGLPLGLAYLYDLGQQLVHPEPEVLQRLGVDTLPLNRWPEGYGLRHDAWEPWTLPDGSQALVPVGFAPAADEHGNQYILDEAGRRVRMRPASGFYFDRIHYPLAEATTVAEIEAYPLPAISDAELEFLRREARRLCETTDKAIVGEFGGSILEGGQDLRGWDRFLMDLVAEPKLAQALMQRLADNAVVNLEKYLAAVGEHIQVIMMGDDLGIQHGLQMSPATYRRMIRPHHTRIYQHVKKHSNAFVLLHSCGAVAPLISDLIEAGVDALNPVQISAKGMDPATLKREFGRDITFWGGGCDSQKILPTATPDEVCRHVRGLVDIFAPGGGFVFAPVHNIQPDVPPENVVAAFDAVNRP